MMESWLTGTYEWRKDLIIWEIKKELFLHSGIIYVESNYTSAFELLKPNSGWVSVIAKGFWNQSFTLQKNYMHPRGGFLSHFIQPIRSKMSRTDLCTELY